MFLSSSRLKVAPELSPRPPVIRLTRLGAHHARPRLRLRGGAGEIIQRGDPLVHGVRVPRSARPRARFVSLRLSFVRSSSVRPCRWERCKFLEFERGNV